MIGGLNGIIHMSIQFDLQQPHMAS